jgi:hypothetical protein
MKRSKKCAKLGVGVEREHIGDILVGSHNQHAAPVPIDAAHVENVAVALEVRTENLLIVAQSVPAFLGQ